jgi:hypothetical protein
VSNMVKRMNLVGEIGPFENIYQDESCWGDGAI